MTDNLDKLINVLEEFELKTTANALKKELQSKLIFIKLLTIIIML